MRYPALLAGSSHCILSSGSFHYQYRSGECLATRARLWQSRAIALFLENPANALLLDEKSARRVAASMSLSILGTVGILSWAKQQGFIISLKEQLDQLVDQGGFRLGQQLYSRALQRVGE